MSGTGKSAPRKGAAKPSRWVRLWKAALVCVGTSALVIPWTIEMGWLRIPTPAFFNDMATQRKARQQAQNPFLPQGIVMQPPVAGTLPRGVEFYPYPKDPDRAGKELVNPLPRTMPNLQRGEQVYNTFCVTCHGYKALGDGLATGLGRLAAPPSLHSAKVTEWSDGHIYHNITMGQNKMPSYASQIKPADRWAAVLYVRVLQRALAPKPGDLPATATLTVAPAPQPAEATPQEETK
jgi:mono/diheme cytochrome c family protein